MKPLWYPRVYGLSHLERHPPGDLLGQSLRYDAIVVGQNLHRQLGLDASLIDEVVQGIGQRKTETVSAP